MSVSAENDPHGTARFEHEYRFQRAAKGQRQAVHDHHRASKCLTLPYLTFGVGRLLHLPSAEAVSVRPNAQPRCNQKVTVIGCEAET